MPSLEYPEKEKAEMVEASIDVGTEGKKTEFTAILPKSLGDALALLGEKVVWRHFMSAYVIKLQGEQRARLQAEVGTKEPRKRAKYLEQVGLGD